MVTAQWEATGEEGQTQQFAGRLNELNKFQHGEWEVTIRVRVASKQTKEPIVGADMGIIVDIRRGSNQVVKASLVQAKRVEVIPEDILDSIGLPSQVAKMKNTTKECYGMVYSSNSTQFFDVDGPPLTFIPVQQFFVDKLRCTRGDRNPIAIAQAYAPFVWYAECQDFGLVLADLSGRKVCHTKHHSSDDLIALIVWSKFSQGLLRSKFNPEIN